MQNIKICVLVSHADAYAPQRLLKEAREMQIDVTLVTYSQVSILFNNKNTILLNNIDIENYTHFIFRSTCTHKSLRQTLIKACSHKKILNYDFLQSSITLNKILQNKLFIDAQLPTIEACVCSDQNSYMKYGLDLLDKNGSVIIKPENGSRGKGIELLKNIDELSKYKDRCEKYILQKYIDTTYDIRVIVLGDNVLGAMKRTKQSDALVTNYSQGGKVEPFVLSPELVKLSKKVAQTIGIEFTGIDIIFDKNSNPYILEANSIPQFEGFEIATGINVAKSILNLLISK